MATLQDAESGRTIRRATAERTLDFSLLRNFQGIVYFNTEVANGTFQLRMTKQKLNGAQVFRALVNQSDLGSS